ncbi:MAG TPA: response regulator [Terriglobales bacterium]|nr:response regulator [Terriglobales bacterium]
MKFRRRQYFEIVPKVSKRRAWVSSSFTGQSRRTERKLLHHDTPYVPGQKTLVWIDDYEPGLALYKLMFEMLGHRVLTASSGKLGLELVAKHVVDAVVVDYEMPGMNGYEVASALKRIRPDLPVVLFSGLTTIPAKILGVVNAYCDKAASREQLLGTIQSVLSKNPVSHLQPTSLPHASEQTQRTVA